MNTPAFIRIGSHNGAANCLGRLARRLLARASIACACLATLFGLALLPQLLSASQPAAPARPSAKPRVFYVATNGNDAWTGSLPAPNRNLTDGPFLTVGRAVSAVRELKRHSGVGVAPPVTAFIRGGTYFLSEPVVFTPADSGTAGSPITYQAFEKETPVLSGGRLVTGWKPATIQGRQVWAAEVPEAAAGKWFFHQLWVNGQRAVRARHPNRGYLAVAELPDVQPNAAWSQGLTSFRFAAGDVRAWPTVTNAEVCVMNRWVESRLPVVEVDESNRLVRFGKRSVFKLDPGDLYYVEHALELLDAPGEWYLDRAAGTLYYLPRPGEDMARAEVVAPVLTQAVRLEGAPEQGSFVEHLAFRGLTFAHTEWYFSSGFDTDKQKAEVSPPPAAAVGGFAQAAVGVPGAVRGDGVRQCAFEQCRFLHLGTYGLELARGCQRNRVSGCELADLGAGGIKLGETAIRDRWEEVSRENEVSDCHVHDGGLMFHSAIGVWIGQSPGNRLLHNHIHDFYYTGISVGWTWGYGRALATNTIVEFNHVHHIGRRADGDGPILSDMGGIYTLGLHAGSVIRNNLWHDCAGLRYGGWGIYFDEGTTGILAENNLVYRTTHGGFHQHYGKENLVRNNVFVDARDHQIQRSRAENHRSFTFERNIVYWHQGKLIEGSLDDTNYLFRANVYWNAKGQPVRFAKWSLAEWQQRGQDSGSVVADPQFVNPALDNYALRGRSPALRLGFEPLSIKRVGVRPGANK